MDTSTFCNSTSTSAPVKLGLRLPVLVFRFDMILISLKLLSRCLWRVHNLMIHPLICSCRCVSVCKFMCMRTLFQFKKTLPGEHSSEHFCCVGTHFQAFMNPVEVFFLRCFSEETSENVRE